MLLVSIAVIILTLLSGDLTRNVLLDPLLPSGSLFKSVAFDAILSIELCAVALELGVIFQHYGIVVWSIGLFCNVLYQLSRWCYLAPPSPYNHVVLWLRGKTSLLETILRSMVLLAMGLMTYRYVLHF